MDEVTCHRDFYILFCPILARLSQRGGGHEVALAQSLSWALRFSTEELKLGEKCEEL